jgi:hypothetical protein
MIVIGKGRRKLPATLWETIPPPNLLGKMDMICRYFAKLLSLDSISLAISFFSLEKSALVIAPN